MFLFQPFTEVIRSICIFGIHNNNILVADSVDFFLQPLYFLFFVKLIKHQSLIFITLLFVLLGVCFISLPQFFQTVFTVSIIFGISLTAFTYTSVELFLFDVLLGYLFNLRLLRFLVLAPLYHFNLDLLQSTSQSNYLFLLFYIPCSQLPALRYQFILFFLEFEQIQVVDSFGQRINFMFIRSSRQFSTYCFA